MGMPRQMTAFFGHAIIALMQLRKSPAYLI